MMLLDASFLYAYYNKDDVYHNQAVEISEMLKKKTDDLIVLDYIFDEVISVSLNRLKNIKTVNAIGNDIINSLGISYVNEEIFEKAWNIFSEQTSTSFSFTDCIIMAYMNVFYIKNLVTFDKEFLKIKELNIIS